MEPDKRDTNDRTDRVDRIAGIVDADEITSGSLVSTVAYVFDVDDEEAHRVVDEAVQRGVISERSSGVFRFEESAGSGRGSDD